ncbi:class I SAM-dependent methyltransferase [Thermopolyspora sp. NPDC052614]|uniref:class I SAM-dependent methyltransferase n=1 Tax=Thermopolyspora sp. NPDC052614 TaxID=3155682 RepID=UPI003420539C
MATAKRALGRLLYGKRYDKVPQAQRVYVRPGERLLRELSWRRLVRGTEIISLEEFKRRVSLGPIEEYLSCMLCGESRQQPLFRPQGEKKKGDTRPAWSYVVVRCPSCGFLYRNPNIRPERLGDLYAKNYSGFLTGDYAANRQRRYRLTMDAFGEVFRDGTGRRLLDFGCGSGLFLELAEERGFDVTGVDLSPDSVKLANERLRRGRAFHGVAEEIPEIARGGFDVITLWSVLAHLPRPLEDFDRFRRMLAPGGVLLILTVNARSLLLKASGSKWNGFTKNHLMFYSSQTLPVLLGRTGFAGVAFSHFYGDTIEAGSTRLPVAYQRRLRRAVEASDGGNMLRAVAFADEDAIIRWGAGLRVRHCPARVPGGEHRAEPPTS